MAKHIPVTDEEIAHARALVTAATPGDWRHGRWQYDVAAVPMRMTGIAPNGPDDISICVDVPPDSEVRPAVISGCGCCGSPEGSAADAALICAAKPTILRFADEIDRLRGQGMSDGPSAKAAWAAGNALEGEGYELISGETVVASSLALGVVNGKSFWMQAWKKGEHILRLLIENS